MTEKIEGTVILDGLIQGKVSALPGSEERLRDWEKFVRSAQLIFNLEITGGTFGFLADQTPIAASALGHDPAETIKAALSELLKIFPPRERGAIFSTLRSVEYKRDQEVQTLYIVAPDGSVQARGRTVSAQTAAPLAPLTLRNRAAHVAVGAVCLVVLLMASSLFVDYREMLAALRSQLRPLDAAHFPVDAGTFERYFTVEAKSAASGGEGLILTLRRTPNFLHPQASTGPSFRSTQSDFEDPRLAANAIGTGYIRCEYFDEKGKFIGFIAVRIKALRDEQSIDLQIPFESDRRPSSILLTY